MVIPGPKVDCQQLPRVSQQVNMVRRWLRVMMCTGYHLHTTGARQRETELSMDPNSAYGPVKKTSGEGVADTDETGVYEVTNY